MIFMLSGHGLDGPLELIARFRFICDPRIDVDFDIIRYVPVS